MKHTARRGLKRKNSNCVWGPCLSNTCTCEPTDLGISQHLVHCSTLVSKGRSQEEEEKKEGGIARPHQYR